uniref:Placental growth factor b n=1 Tax=Poecilia reticulata TaxID=8081 RepID=A0A3P9PGQ4_POERE
IFHFYLLQLLHLSAVQSLNKPKVIPTWLILLFFPTVLMFQEVWGRSFCRTMEKLVEVVQEYPTEVEHIYSPSCVPLVRCAGCCGDENLECHPTETSNVTMQVKKTAKMFILLDFFTQFYTTAYVHCILRDLDVCLRFVVLLEHLIMFPQYCC